MNPVRALQQKITERHADYFLIPFTKATEKYSYRLNKYEKLKQEFGLDQYDNQSTFPNNTIEFSRSNEVQLADLKHHIPFGNTSEQYLYSPNKYDRLKQEFGLDQYGDFKQLKSYQTPFANTTEQYSYSKNKYKRKKLYGLDQYGKLKQLKSYQSTFPNGTIKFSRSKEAKLGELKHHVFVLKLHNKWRMQYRAFCAGSIITEIRVLSSAQCFYTNRKRLRHTLNQLRVAAGLLFTTQSYPADDSKQQWRTPTHVYSQRFYRFPAYSLAVVQLDKPWEFNENVNRIPYSKLNQDFDGVCTGTVVKVTKSWAVNKYLYTEQYRIIPRETCERMLLRTCRLYLCTMDEGGTVEPETAGSGLICYETGDPNEDETAGLLAGVTVLINVGLPSLHLRVGLFHKWITDACAQPKATEILLLYPLLLICLK